jgi:hypothetical protein
LKVWENKQREKTWKEDIERKKGPAMYNLQLIAKKNVKVNIIIKKNPWHLVRKRTIPTEQPPLVGEI